MKPTPRASAVTRTATALASARSALLLTSCATAPATLTPAITSGPVPQPVPNPLPPMPRTLSGTIAYGARAVLPPGATVKVTLAEVSTTEAPARVIAETTFAPAGRPLPLPFVLAFDAARLDARHTYAVSARIEQQGRLLWVTSAGNGMTPATLPAAVNLVLAQVP